MILNIKSNKNRELNLSGMDAINKNMIKKLKSFNKYFSASIFLLGIVLCITQIAAAASATITWNRNQEPDIAGYRVYWGTSSHNYSDSVTIYDSATQPIEISYAINGLVDGNTYYCAVKAFDLAGQESNFSDEVVKNIPGSSVPISPISNDGFTFYEDAEDGLTPGWDIYDNSPAGAEIINVYDSERNSQVIEFSGDGTKNGYRLRMADGSKWHNDSQFVVQWSMKYNENYTVYIDVKTTGGHRYLTYRPFDYNILGTGEYVTYGLGTQTFDGAWHTFTRDLKADLQAAQPGNEILEVNGFLIRGSGMLDDIKLLNSTPQIVYEDAEDGLTPGWDIYDNSPAGAAIINAYDFERNSQVIELSGDGTKNGYRLRMADGSKWHNNSQFVVQWSMKYSENYTVYIDVKTIKGHRYLTYRPLDYNVLGTGEYVTYGLGTQTFDGAWHTFTRDLKADLQAAQPGNEILEVNGFLIRGSGMLDDIKLLNSTPQIVYEDAEDGLTPGWDIYDNSPAGAAIINVYDFERNSQVIELSGDGTKNGYRLRMADGGKWHNNSQFVVQWSMKYSENYTVYIDVKTTGGHRYLTYRPFNYNVLGTGEYVTYGLGTQTFDGAWHTFTRDLKADLQAAQPGNEILEVNGFLIRGSGMLDDIKLLSY